MRFAKIGSNQESQALNGLGGDKTAPQALKGKLGTPSLSLRLMAWEALKTASQAIKSLLTIINLGLAFCLGSARLYLSAQPTGRRKLGAR